MKVGGLTNPKEVKAVVSFVIQTFDTSENMIDTSNDGSGFTVKMMSAGYIGSI